jgi:hypothetical protein
MARSAANRAAHGEGDSGVASFEQLDHRGQQAVTGRRERTDSQCARTQSGNVVELSAGGQQLRFDALGATDQCGAGFSEPNAAGVPLQKWLSRFGFQFRDLLRYCRRGVVQPGRGGGDGAGSHHIDKQQDSPRVKHYAPIKT